MEVLILSRAPRFRQLLHTLPQHLVALVQLLYHVYRLLQLFAQGFVVQTSEHLAVARLLLLFWVLLILLDDRWHVSFVQFRHCRLAGLLLLLLKRRLFAARGWLVLTGSEVIRNVLTGNLAKKLDVLVGLRQLSFKPRHFLLQLMDQFHFRIDVLGRNI